MIDWIKEELAREEIYPSSEGIRKILDDEPTGFEDSLVDLVFLLKDQWDRA